MNINSPTDRGVCANPASRRKPLVIRVSASIHADNIQSPEEIVAKAFSLGATLVFPEGFDVLDEPGLVPCAFTGHVAMLPRIHRSARAAMAVYA